MAMITYNKYGNEISDKAAVCIGCAVPLLATSLAIAGKRLILSFCIFVLAENFAQAYQYCGNLPINSAAYYSCESLNQQENFEQDRKIEAQEKESSEREQNLKIQEALQFSPELQPIIGGFLNAKKLLEARECYQTQSRLKKFRLSQSGC